MRRSRPPIALAPNAPEGFWQAGFGQTLSWRGRELSYRLQSDGISGSYTGPGPQVLRVRLRESPDSDVLRVEANGLDVEAEIVDGWILLNLSAPIEGKSGSFTAMRQK